MNHEVNPSRKQNKWLRPRHALPLVAASLAIAALTYGNEEKPATVKFLGQESVAFDNRGIYEIARRIEGCDDTTTTLDTAVDHIAELNHLEDPSIVPGRVKQITVPKLCYSSNENIIKPAE